MLAWMSATAFDTLKLARRLTTAGMTAAQAEGVAEALAEVVVAEPATRTDVEGVRVDLRTEIAALRAEFRAEFASIRAEFEAFRVETRAEFASIRAELANDRARTSSEFVAVRAEMQAGFAGVKYEILRWIVPLMLGQTVVIVGAMVRLAR